MKEREALTPEKVREALVQVDGSPSKAAALLGVDRSTVWRWMQRHGIKVERVVKAA